MGFWLPFLALAGGGWYGANKLSDGALNETAGAFISDSASNLGGKVVDGALDKAGLDDDSAMGNFFKDHWGKTLLGAGGLLGAMKLPKPLRGLAMAAAVVIGLVTIVQHYSSEKLQGDFEVAGADTQELALPNVPSRNNPEYVLQNKNGAFDLGIDFRAPEAEPS